MNDEVEDTSQDVADEVQETDSAPVDEGQAQEEEGKAPESDGEGSPATDDAGASRSKGVERRIGQLTRRFREEQRQNAELKAELERIKQRLGPPPELVRPKVSDFNTTEDYEDALLRWHDARREPTPATPPPKPMDPAAEKLIKGIEALGDPDVVDEVLNSDWPCSPGMYEYLVNSERGPELSVALASDLDLAEKLAKLSPVLAARELVKLEAGLPAAKPSAARAAPLPPPIKPVKPGSTQPNVDPDKLSDEEWVRRERARLAQRA